MLSSVHTKLTDELQPLIAKRFLAAKRESRTLARNTHNTFPLLIEHIPDTNAVRGIARGIDSRMANPFEIKGMPLSPQADIDVCFYENHNV